MPQWIANEYRLVDEQGQPYDHRDLRFLKIESRGAGTWAIVDAGSVLNNKGKWEYEPRPSSRTEEFIQRTRYPLEEAKARAMKIVEEALCQIKKLP